MGPVRSSRQNRLPSFFVLALVLLFPIGVGHGEQADKVKPDKGVFLVAKPKVEGQFSQSVVLLLMHGETGTLGVIINRLTKASLDDVLPDLERGSKETHRVFFGGPVALNGLLFVFRSTRPPEGASHVMGDVYFSAELEVFEKVLKRKTSSSALRLFLGHSGWGPGQLKWEIGRGDWELVRADTETVFEKDPKMIWPELMGPVTRQVVDGRDVREYRTP